MNKLVTILTIYFVLLNSLSYNKMGNKSAADVKSVSVDSAYVKGTFGYDLNFLKQYHKDLVLLGDSAGAITL